MLAVVPVRDGVLPAGADEVVAECGGRAVLVGSAPDAGQLAGIATDVRLVELGAFAPARWAQASPALVDDDVVVLPGSPDGRDLAPRLAHVLGRRLLAGAVAVTATHAQLARGGGRDLHDVAIREPVVATLQPGVRGVARAAGAGPGRRHRRRRSRPRATIRRSSTCCRPTSRRWTSPRPTASSAAAPASTAPDRFAQLAAVAAPLGASTGATRVITDRGWIGHERQIGTTGVVVDPDLYLAFGISGAVQHTAGLGTPAHVVSVNTDPHCPMMQMADLAIVADANAVLDELARRLEVTGG